MAFTATLESVQRSGDPTKVEINVLYLSSDYPNWRAPRTIPITLDPNLTPAEQRQAIVQKVREDASPYFKQLAAFAGLTALAGSSIDITS